MAAMKPRQTFVAFTGTRLAARGDVETIVLRLYPLSGSAQAELRLLDETTGRTFDLDWRGRADEVVARAKAQLGVGVRGRPKLGVESREISLLPRHWNWLDAQGRSASATLRGLVNQAMGQPESDRADLDGLYRQMSALGGDLPGFEEAARCLYAHDFDGTERVVATWPGDLGSYFSDRVRSISTGARS